MFATKLPEPCNPGAGGTTTTTTTTINVVMIAIVTTTIATFIATTGITICVVALIDMAIVASTLDSSACT